MWGLYIHTDESQAKPKRIPKPMPRDRRERPQNLLAFCSAIRLTDSIHRSVLLEGRRIRGGL
jgi:hypothetical protein